MIETVKPSKAAITMREEMLAVMQKHGADCTQQEILAMLAYTIGQCLAMMDQRVWTPETAMAVISHNLELGNQDAIIQLMNSQGGTQ